MPEQLRDVTIDRDSYGIPHVTAATQDDAWFGMGFACATDRMFQLEYDRRRAVGRWAEVAGPSAVAQDILARRLGLGHAARRDVAAMSPRTRAAFDAYARGVNAAVAEGAALPKGLTKGAAEGITAEETEPWEPWHSIAAFKVRHVMMGHWQVKLAQAFLLSRVGELSRAGGTLLNSAPPPRSPLTVPPGARRASRQDHENSTIQDVSILEQALLDTATGLGYPPETESGSNAWAVSAKLTTSNTAVICNDSHRPLDTPNAYWQCRVTCPDFDVSGATFPGLPGFPHFGNNGHVAWAITHADADTQDLYLERFEGDRYLTADGWSPAKYERERIEVRDAEPVDTTVWRTQHGQIVHGDPRNGLAIALKYTATQQPNRGFECLLPMLTAKNVTELADAQNGWVDPVNNLVAADAAGSIAYQCRGELPVRSSPAHRMLPVPGWDGECEWTGTVPFEDMPRVIDPREGFVLTANNMIIDADRPYISRTFSQPFRAERIRELLTEKPRHTSAGLAAMQGDTVSWAARAWTRVLRDLPSPPSEHAENARRMLADWDGDLAPDSAAALLYGCFQRALAAALYRPVLGDRVWEWVAGQVPVISLVRRWLANDTWELLNGTSEHAPEALPEALAEAWTQAEAQAGPDPATWRWADVHQATRIHPMAGRLGTIPMGGDADTIQAAGYGWRSGTPFTVTSLSVYRQVVDMGEPDEASYVIPGGSSGDPDGPHFDDQIPVWAAHRRIQMRPSNGRS